jgi:phage terminase large subunit-like protein
VHGPHGAATKPFDEATVIVSRRAGKSRVMAALAVFHACIVDHSRHISTGERPVVAIISSDRRNSRVIFDYVRALIADTPLLADLIEEQTKESLTHQ